MLESLDSGIHINSEGNNDIESDNDTEVVEDDEVVAIDGGPWFDIDAHGHNHVPIVDHDQHEQGDVGRHQVIEVHQVIVVRDWRVVHDLGTVDSDQTTKHDRSDESENVKDCHHHNDQVVQWAKQVLQSLKDDSHSLDFEEKREEFEHADKDDDFEDFDRVVVLLEVVVGSEEHNHRRQVQQLAQSLRPDTEVVPVSFDDTRNSNISNRLEKHEDVNRELKDDPCSDSAFTGRLL